MPLFPLRQGFQTIVRRTEHPTIRRLSKKRTKFRKTDKKGENVMKEHKVDAVHYGPKLYEIEVFIS